MKTLFAMAVGTPTLWVSGLALAQTGSMMDGYGGMSGGGWMGGYGGFWGPALLVLVIAAVVVWVMKHKGK
jgi:uncharacterized membrane protein